MQRIAEALWCVSIAFTVTRVMVPTKTVLVADDTAVVRERFRLALEQAGHRMVIAASAADVLARVRTQDRKIDLAILSLRLPQARGVELVRSIRKLPHGALPVLVFGGTITHADEVRELNALGVSGYVNEHSAIPQILPSLAPHLFPERFNRRGSPRVSLSIPIQYRSDHAMTAALTLNLSRGGMAVRTASPLEASLKVRIRFRMPGSEREINADGRVAWSDARVGMGVQFSNVESTGQTTIDEFVDAHFFASRKPESEKFG